MKHITLSTNRKVFSFALNRIKLIVFLNERIRYDFNQTLDALITNSKPSAYADEHRSINAQLFIDENRIQSAGSMIERINMDDRFDESLKMKKGSLGYRILYNLIEDPQNQELLMQLNGYLSLLNLSFSVDDSPVDVDFGSLNLGILSKITNVNLYLDSLATNYLDYDFNTRLEFVVKSLNQGVGKERTKIFVYECFELDEFAYGILETLLGYVFILCRKVNGKFPIEEHYFVSSHGSIDFANEILVRREIMESNNCIGVTDLLRYYLNK